MVEETEDPRILLEDYLFNLGKRWVCKEQREDDEKGEGSHSCK